MVGVKMNGQAKWTGETEETQNESSEQEVVKSGPLYSQPILKYARGNGKDKLRQNDEQCSLSTQIVFSG